MEMPTLALEFLSSCLLFVDDSTGPQSRPIPPLRPLRRVFRHDGRAHERSHRGHRPHRRQDDDGQRGKVRRWMRRHVRGVYGIHLCRKDVIALYE